jgi:hypothetical protein
MKASVLLLLVAAAAGMGSASPIAIDDPFPGTQWPAPGADVIGVLTDFDIQSITGDFDAASSVIRIAFNTRNSDLSPYNDFGVQLNVGDLLFEAGGVYKYGVPLYTHAGSPNGGPSGSTVLAGHLYQINNPATGTLTAKQVLNNPGLIYRPDEVVWLRSQGASLTDLAAGAVTVAKYGNGTSNAEYLATLQFANPASFYEDLGGGMLLHFASATCGNDIAEGMVHAPEPSSNAMIGGGLVLLGLFARRFRRGC